MKRNSRYALIANRYANLRSQKETPSGKFRPLRRARRLPQPPPRKLLKKLEQNFFAVYGGSNNNILKSALRGIMDVVFVSVIGHIAVLGFGEHDCLVGHSKTENKLGLKALGKR